MRIRSGGLLPYCIVAGSMSLGYGSIYTLLADLRDRYGFTEAQLGYIVAAGFLAGFVTQLSLARLADRGYAPMLVRGGIVLAMGAMIGSALATEFWAFLVARLLLGLGSGAVGPAMRRIVITREPDAVGANLGRLAAFDVAGFMLGPLVAAVVAQAFGIRAPFLFLAVVFVGVLVLASRLDLNAGVAERARGTRAAHAARAARDPGDPRGERRVLPHRRDVRGDLGGAAARPRRRDVAHRPHAVVVHAADDLPRADRRPRRAVARSVARGRDQPERRRRSARSRTACCPSLWMLLGVSLIHAVADSFTMPSNQVAAALGSPPEHLSAAQGLLGATGLAAAGLTGLAAGFVYEEVGRFAVCTGTAVLMVMFLTIALTLGRRELADTPEMVGTDEPLSPDAIGSGVPDLP